MNNNKILHFTLGPVQGFVAQARRTRDLWGGSFLLSWLAGQAMRAVLDNGGKIVFPIVHDASRVPTDPLLKAIRTGGVGQPRIGTIPNRFKAEVPDGFKPKVCVESINRVWKTVCDIVWNTYVKGVANEKTKEIWKRQTEGFWDIAWVCGKAPTDKSDDIWLDQRKNWRSHRPPDEGGDHCMIMGDWQELSGFIRYMESNLQDEFWKNMRNQNGIGKLDLREGERLCAIALVKRLFPKVAKNAIGWEMNISNWPSTSYMAAIPWILKAWQTDRKLCLEYAKRVDRVLPESGSERNTSIKCLDKAATADPECKKFSGMDGNVFQVHAIANKKLTLLEETAREELLTALKALKNKTAAPLTPYYAMLIMDGDKMGALLREHAEEVSSGLAKFTDSVADIVAGKNGVTIYAGGDDVLAMLPLDYAIAAAHKLREAYQKAFNGVEWATISATIVYAHHHQPLRGVLQQAHRQLDGIAKEQNGRDSLALCVLKGGDISSSWVGRWEPNKGYFPAQELMKMADTFAREADFSSRFLYALRDRLHDLLDSSGRVVHGIDIEQVLLAEYLKNREANPDRTAAETTVKALVQAISRYPREPLPRGKVALQPDGPIVLRFLAFKGVDE